MKIRVRENLLFAALPRLNITNTGRPLIGSFLSLPTIDKQFCTGPETADCLGGGSTGAGKDPSWTQHLLVQPASLTAMWVTHSPDWHHWSGVHKPSVPKRDAASDTINCTVGFLHHFLGLLMFGSHFLYFSFYFLYPSLRIFLALFVSLLYLPRFFLRVCFYIQNVFKN
jgi:hypothetical protein